jgi:hypothetical protein
VRAIEAVWACTGCGRAASVEDLGAAETLPCPCGKSVARHAGTLDGERVARCAVCGDPRLYEQKDFNATLGIGLLVVGFAIAVVLGVFVGPWGFFIALGASAGLDALLYLVAGQVVVCHWCEAHYRGDAGPHPEFDLTLHDLVRHQREVAAAGQPVPEHEGRAGPSELHPTRYDG